MAKKKKVGRPKMAKNTQKKGFPLRLHPKMIKRIKGQAKDFGMKPGPYVEFLMERYIGTMG